MANVATLTVSITGNSARLQSEFKKANRSAKTFSDKLKNTLKTAGTALTRLGAGASVGLAALAASGIQAADALAKTSQKLGLAADELAGLRFAAEQTGNSTRNLDLGIQRMTRRIAEAAQGTGEAKNALKELGLSAQELTRKSPAEAFKDIATAMATVEGQSNKVRLGFKLFDSEGVGLVNTLDLGAEGLERMAEEARTLGLALTPGQLKGIQAAADAGGKLKSAFSGFSQQLASTFAPAMQAAADGLTSLLSKVTGLLPKFQALTDKIFGIKRAVDQLTFDAINTELIRVGAEINDLETQIASAFRSNQQFPLRGYLDGIEILQDQLKTAKDRALALLEQQRKLSEETDKPLDPNSFVNTVPQKLEEIRVRIQRLDTSKFDRLRGIGQRVRDSNNPFQSVIRDLQEVREAVRAGILSEAEFEEYRDSVFEGMLEPIKDAAKKSKEPFNKMSEFAKQAASNIQSNFADFLFDPFDKGLKGMLKSFLDTIRRMLAEIAAQQILTSIFSGFSNSGNGIISAIGGALSQKPSGSSGAKKQTVTPVIENKSKTSQAIEAVTKPLPSIGQEKSFVFSPTYNIDAQNADRELATRLPAILEQVQQRTVAEIITLAQKGRLRA